MKEQPQSFMSWKLLFILTLLPINSIADTISTVAGNGIAGYTGDNISAINTRLNRPHDVAVDNNGNIYIADMWNNRIRQVSPSGIINTVAGSSVAAGYGGDGGSAINARLSWPRSIAVDSNNNLYIADTDNNRIRKVTPDGIINTIVGTGASGYGGDAGLAENAVLKSPMGISLDKNNNLYIADYGNNRIRKVTTDGIINTVAGNGEYNYSGDGSPAISAALRSPIDIAIDVNNNLYIADLYNNRIRKVTPLGIIDTLAGNGAYDFTGDNGLATEASLREPSGVTVDSSGNVYIADTNNYRIRKVTPAGVITTIIGNGIYGYSEDGTSATNSALKEADGISIDNHGNLYIAMQFDHRVRKVTVTPNSSFSLPANQWKFFGLPLNPGATNTVQGIFGDDLNTADYGTRWTVYGRTAAGDGTYYSLNLTDTLTNGEGYWILSLDTATVDMDGTAIATVDNKVEANLPKAAVNLSRNVPVAYPFTTAQPWTNVTQIKMVNDSVGASEVTANSSATGFMYSGSSYVAGNLWTYNGTSYVAGKPTMNPWDAFWAYLRDPAYIHLNNNGSMKLLLPKP